MSGKSERHALGECGNIHAKTWMLMVQRLRFLPDFAEKKGIAYWRTGDVTYKLGTEVCASLQSDFFFRRAEICSAHPEDAQLELGATFGLSAIKRIRPMAEIFIALYYSQTYNMLLLIF
jgi:hypothetical protein